MTTITITTSAPADPATVTEYGDALPELVRALNHIPRHHEASDYPSDADRLIRNVAQAVGRLPQLLGQVDAWLAQEGAAGRITIPHSGHDGAPLAAVAAARVRLGAAGAAAIALQEALDSAASVTCDLEGTETGEDSGGE